MPSISNRRTPEDVDALDRHIALHGLHLHRTTNPPFRWVLISGDEGYIPCAEVMCLKREIMEVQDD